MAMNWESVVRTARAVVGAGSEGPRIAVAVSGGGYRASIWALAALAALEERGAGAAGRGSVATTQRGTGRIVAVSGVSGGGLVAAHYVADKVAGRGFEETEAALVGRLSSLEMARSVVAAELASAGDEMAEAMGSCLAGKFGEVAKAVGGWFEGLLGGGGRRPDALGLAKKMLRECAEAGDEALAGARLSEGIEAFTGQSCGRGRQSATQCAGQGPRTFGAAVVGMAGGLIGGDGFQREVLGSYCAMVGRRCAQEGPAGYLEADSSFGEVARPQQAGERRPHPFADLIHMAFLPQGTERGSLRMGDLRHIDADRTAPLLVLGGTSTSSGDAWAVTQEGAGVLEEDAPVREPRGFHPFGQGHPRGIRVADALAATACYPLVCRPVPIQRPGEPASLAHLTDGGVHDNLAVRQLYALKEHHDGPDWDVLVIVDAHRLAPPPGPSTSRVGTLLRLHDLMHEQQAEVTLDWVRREERAKAGGLFGLRQGCRVVHLSLAQLGADNPLASLPTDLRPLPAERIRSMLADAKRVIAEELSKSSCVGRRSKGARAPTR